MNERTKEQSRYIDWAKLSSAIRSSFMLDFLCVTISCQMWPHDSRNDNNLIYMTSSLPLIKQVDPGCDKDVARCDQNVARCDQVVARCQYMLPGQINALRDVIRCCQVWPGVTRLWPEPYFYYKNLNKRFWPYFSSRARTIGQNHSKQPRRRARSARKIWGL